MSDPVERRVSERIAANRSGDFAAADRIRDDLASEGVRLADCSFGTTWRQDDIMRGAIVGAPAIEGGY